MKNPSAERFIEDSIIRSPTSLGYEGALVLRNCRAGRRMGIADVVILPSSGPHRMVVIEAKAEMSADAAGKVVGQLLVYYAAALMIGEHGLSLMRTFARENPETALNHGMVSLRMLSGGIAGPDLAWAELQKGEKLSPQDIALFVALNCEPTGSLSASLSVLHQHHGLSIGLIQVSEEGRLSVRRAAPTSACSCPEPR